VVPLVVAHHAVAEVDEEEEAEAEVVREAA